MERAEFAEGVEGCEALECVGEADDAEGRPHVFAEARGYGLLADEGELFKGIFVLGLWVSNGSLISESGLRSLKNSWEAIDVPACSYRVSK